MSEEQKPGDEPKAEAKKGKAGQKRSTKPEPLKAVVIAKHVDGRSNLGIAKDLGIDRKTVAHIIEEADMETTLMELGYSNKAIVSEHLEPLLRATKSGMYGTEVAGATRLGAVRLLDKWKGISARMKAKIDAEVARNSPQVRSETHTVCVVVSNRRRAAELARLISAGSPTGVVIDVDAQVDANVG